MAIRGMRNTVGSRSLGVQLISLPNACDLASCAVRRRMSERFVLDSRISIVVSITSTSTLRQGLCLALRLLRLNGPIILTLGVVSVIRGHNVRVSARELPRVLNVPIVPISTEGQAKLSILLRTTTRRGSYGSPRYLVRRRGCAPGRQRSRRSRCTVICDSTVRSGVSLVVTRLGQGCPGLSGCH